MIPLTPWGLVPLYVKVLLILALVAGGVIGWEAFLHHQQTIGAERQKAADDARNAKATIDKLKSDADETQRRLLAQKGNQDAQDKELARARAGRDAALSAYGRLSDDLTAFVATNGGACNSSAVGDGKAACAPFVLLADMLRRRSAELRELATFADAGRAAGLKCERDYDALTPAH